MGTIFVAGSYGVGKSTLCDVLSQHLEMPYFSAGDLISRVNGETYGATKAVSNKSANQDILATEIQRIHRTSPNILLAGHFCIFDKANHVEPLPVSIYANLGIDCILLLETNPERIVSNLGTRDKKTYTPIEMGKLVAAENKCAHSVAKMLSCPLFIHTMCFDGTDADTCISILRRDHSIE